MPIDDATVRWSERRSPFRRVAMLTIPRQVFWPAAGMPPADLEGHQRHDGALGENMSFMPWHGLTAHEPLGDINDARRRDLCGHVDLSAGQEPGDTAGSSHRLRLVAPGRAGRAAVSRGPRADDAEWRAVATPHARRTYLPDDEPHGIALCLSGGGFRAALFHLGAVRRLYELGLLDTVSTVAVRVGWQHDRRLSRQTLRSLAESRAESRKSGSGRSPLRFDRSRHGT